MMPLPAGSPVTAVPLTSPYVSAAANAPAPRPTMAPPSRSQDRTYARPAEPAESLRDEPTHSTSARSRPVTVPADAPASIPLAETATRSSNPSARSDSRSSWLPV